MHLFGIGMEKAPENNKKNIKLVRHCALIIIFRTVPEYVITNRGKKSSNLTRDKLN